MVSTQRKVTAKRNYDFVTSDPKTGCMVEVKIVRYCGGDVGYEMPLPPEDIAERELKRFAKILIRYLYKK